MKNLNDVKAYLVANKKSLLKKAAVVIGAGVGMIAVAVLANKFAPSEEASPEEAAVEEPSIPLEIEMPETAVEG